MWGSMIRGFLKLPRSNFDAKCYRRLKVIGLHQYLRNAACFQVSFWQGMTLYPGQLATSVATLSEDTGETVKAIRIMLDDVEHNGFIKSETKSYRFTLITLLDYAAVQGLPCLYGFFSGASQKASQRASARASRKHDIGASQRASRESDINEFKLTFYREENNEQGQAQGQAENMTQGQAKGQAQGQAEGQHSENNNINNTNTPPYIPPKGEEKVKRFVKPTVEEIKKYCKERENTVDAEAFFNYYQSNGWKVGGKSPMKDWQAAVRTWEKNGNSNKKVTTKSKYSGRF
jgi:hypothetical protein